MAREVGRVSADGVPFDAFLDALKAGLIEARRRVRRHQEAALAAELRAAACEQEGARSMIVRLPSTDGATGEDVRVSIPHRCLMAAPYLQVSELCIDFAVQMTAGEGEGPVIVELLGRPRARRDEGGRLLIRLGGDDAVSGSVMFEERLLKEF